MMNKDIGKIGNKQLSINNNQAFWALLKQIHSYKNNFDTRK